MIPPFNAPGNASCSERATHVATSASPSSASLLWRCSPRGFAGPQPKQTDAGAYRPWRLVDSTRRVYRQFGKDPPGAEVGRQPGRPARRFHEFGVPLEPRHASLRPTPDRLRA